MANLYHIVISDGQYCAQSTSKTAIKGFGDDYTRMHHT